MIGQMLLYSATGKLSIISISDSKHVGFPNRLTIPTCHGQSQPQLCQPAGSRISSMEVREFKFVEMDTEEPGLAYYEETA